MGERRPHPGTIVVVLALVGASAQRADGAPTTTSWRAARLTARADSLLESNRRREGFAYLDSLLQVAREGRDRALEIGVHVAHGRALAFSGESVRSRAELDSALAMAIARRDTLWIERAMMSLALLSLFEGHLRESTPIYRQALPLARRMGDSEYASFAWMGLAYDAVLSGRPRKARDGYRKAIALGEGVISPRASRTARIGLGRSLAALRDYDGARVLYRRVLEESQRDHDRVHERDALNNLGAMEETVGDPATAAEYWERAAEVDRSTGRSIMASTPVTNSAVALANLGRLDEASNILEREAVELDSLGARLGRAAVLNELGIIRRMQGRLEESERIFRGTVSMGDTLQLTEANAAVAGLARALAGQGRWSEAVDSLAGFERGHAGRVLEFPGDDIDHIFVSCLLALHRPREALDLAARAERAGPGPTLATGWAPLSEALAWRTIGRPDSALVAARRAVRQWASWRGASRDPSWREIRGAEGASVCAELADLMLESPGGALTENQARAAFDALQPFKARALEDRMRGPDMDARWEASTRVGADSLQHSVLREGEVFLDFFVAEDTSFVFAVTRHEIRAARLPGARALASRTARFRELLMSAPTSADAADAAALCDSAGLVVGSLIFGPVADLVRHGRRLLISADEMLAVLPLGATLLAPAPGAVLDPLLVGREVLLVPSATLLAELRARAARPSAAPRKLLVLGRTTDAEGRPLRGVDREARWLGRSFGGVDVRVRKGEASLAVVAAELRHYEVLHLAAHTRVDANLPWRSGILIGAADPTSTAGDPYLRASTIAGLHLPARLCVLSGCSSAGSHGLFGAGLQGLSSAFVSAGVPTVIATLWPVDDATTAELVERFYRGLSRGASAGAALRQAQLDLRARPATRHPFYWAGFVLVGEPSTRVALTRKAGPLQWRGQP